MAALIVFFVAALIFQASAQLFNAPNFGAPFLQPLPKPLVQSIEQVSVLPPQLNLFPINTFAPLFNPPVSTTVVENTVANYQPLQQVSSLSLANNLLPLNNYLSFANAPTVVESPVAFTQPIQEVSQVSTGLPSLNNLFPFNNYAPLSNLPVVSSTVVENTLTNQPLQEISQISSISPLSPCLFNLPLNPYANPTSVIPTTVADNSLASSLANTLQLLLVSELLQSSVSPAPSLASNIVPLYDAIGTIGTTASAVDVLSTSVDVTTVGTNSAIDVSTVVTDVVASAPIAPVLQAPVAAITEVTSSVASFPSTTITDAVTVTPVTAPVVYPNYIQSAPAYVTEVTDIVAPVQVSPLATFTEISSVQVSPLSYDYYSGYPEVVTTLPFPAEIILPQSIPAQIRCNFGYAPGNVPYMNMNVEPLGNGFVF